jgi:ATP-dependent Zn protease
VQKSVTPGTVIVALLILAVIIVGVWYFTMGKKAKKPGGTTNAATMQPKTPEAAKAAGYGVTPESVNAAAKGGGGAPPK